MSGLALPAGVLVVLADAPGVARETLEAVILDGWVLAAAHHADPPTAYAVLASWCTYQALACTSDDAAGVWLDALAEAATVLAGDALEARRPDPYELTPELPWPV